MKDRRIFIATGLAVAAVLVVSQAVAYKAMQNHGRLARYQQRDSEIRAAREFSYEINERVSWRKARRYFVEAANGMLTELTRDEVIKCLTNGTSESAS